MSDARFPAHGLRVWRAARSNGRRAARARPQDAALAGIALCTSAAQPLREQLDDRLRDGPLMRDGGQRAATAAEEALEEGAREAARAAPRSSERARQAVVAAGVQDGSNAGPPSTAHGRVPS